MHLIFYNIDCIASGLQLILTKQPKKNRLNERPPFNKNNLINFIKNVDPQTSPSFASPEQLLVIIRKNNMHDDSGINFSTKSDYLPITIETELKDCVQVEIMISHQNMIAKLRGESINVPTNIQKQKYVKINFGQQCRKATLRPLNSLKKIDRKLIITEKQGWKQQQKQQVLSSYHVSIQSILFLIKSKAEKQQRKTQIHYKNSISGFMRTKFSERGNLKSHNAIVKRSEHLILGKQDEQKKQVNTTTISRTRRHDSHTLEIQNALQQVKDKERRDSNASTSIRVESRDIKFSKRIKRLRELADTKNTSSQKQVVLDDTSDLFPVTKIKPRFYQHINLSQQQIDLKRRKFDSQFITKKSVLPTTNIDIGEKQASQSQVTEDICKMEASKTIPPIEDTLQRGIALNQPPAQQSGTLCQSVYQ